MLVVVPDREAAGVRARCVSRKRVSTALEGIDRTVVRPSVRPATTYQSKGRKTRERPFIKYVRTEVGGEWG